jgi:hypothetical protein
MTEVKSGLNLRNELEEIFKVNKKGVREKGIRFISLTKDLLKK